MALTPEGIAAQTFTEVERGFDPTEVRTFLTDVAHQLRLTNDLLGPQHDRLKQQIDRLEALGQSGSGGAPWVPSPAPPIPAPAPVPPPSPPVAPPAVTISRSTPVGAEAAPTAVGPMPSASLLDATTEKLEEASSLLDGVLDGVLDDVMGKVKPDTGE